jgi:hypothetical protein
MDVADSNLPPGVDPTVPSVGRMYDYFLNGRYHLPVDVEAAERVRQVIPEAYYMIHSNRGFLQRAAGRIAREGITQFIDIGAGIPTQWNTHEVVHTVNPEAIIVYVDNDPLVIHESTEILRRRGETKAIYIEGDIRDPEGILNHPDVRKHIEFSRPIGYIHAMVWHFVSRDLDAYALMRRYLDAVVSGSYLALSHATADGQRPDKIRQLYEIYAKTNAHGDFRTWEEIDKFFDGLEYLPPYEGAEPGLSYCDKWGSKNPDEVDPAHTWVPAGVARKP